MVQRILNYREIRTVRLTSYLDGLAFTNQANLL